MSTPRPPMPPASGQEPTQTLKRTHSCRCSRSPTCRFGPNGRERFWHNDATRVAVIVGGILVGCLLLGGMALTAAVGVGALVNNQDDGPGMHGA